MTRFTPYDTRDRVESLEKQIGAVLIYHATSRDNEENQALGALAISKEYITNLLALDDQFWNGDERDTPKLIKTLERRYPQYLRNRIIRDAVDAVQLLAESPDRYLASQANKLVRGDNWAAVRLYDAHVRTDRL